MAGATGGRRTGRAAAAAGPWRTAACWSRRRCCAWRAVVVRRARSGPVRAVRRQPARPADRGDGAVRDRTGPGAEAGRRGRRRARRSRPPEPGRRHAAGGRAVAGGGHRRRRRCSSARCCGPAATTRPDAEDEPDDDRAGRRRATPTCARRWPGRPAPGWSGWTGGAAGRPTTPCSPAGWSSRPPARGSAAAGPAPTPPPTSPPGCVAAVPGLDAGVLDELRADVLAGPLRPRRRRARRRRPGPRRAGAPARASLGPRRRRTGRVPGRGRQRPGRAAAGPLPAARRGARRRSWPPASAGSSAPAPGGRRSPPRPSSPWGCCCAPPSRWRPAGPTRPRAAPARAGTSSPSRPARARGRPDRPRRPARTRSPRRLGRPRRRAAPTPAPTPRAPRSACPPEHEETEMTGTRRRPTGRRRARPGRRADGRERPGPGEPVVPLPVAEVAARGAAVLAEVGGAVVGMTGTLRLALAAVLAGGHVLVEDVPGLGKTLAARSLASALGLGFTRLQCTPDLLPSDVTGSFVFDPATTAFVFRPGPGVHGPAAGRRGQPHAAQDAGRAARGDAGGPGHRRGPDHPAAGARSTCSPRPTRSSTRAPTRCPRPSSTGSSSGSRSATPSPAQEAEVLRRRVARRAEAAAVRAVVDAATLRRDAGRRGAGRRRPRRAWRYCVALAAATRTHSAVEVGASPRGSLALLLVARARRGARRPRRRAARGRQAGRARPCSPTG